MGIPAGTYRADLWSRVGNPLEGIQPAESTDGLSTCLHHPRYGFLRRLRQQRLGVCLCPDLRTRVLLTDSTPTPTPNGISPNSGWSTGRPCRKAGRIPTEKFPSLCDEGEVLRSFLIQVSPRGSLPCHRGRRESCHVMPGESPGRQRTKQMSGVRLGKPTQAIAPGSPAMAFSTNHGRCAMNIRANATVSVARRFSFPGSSVTDFYSLASIPCLRPSLG